MDLGIEVLRDELVNLVEGNCDVVLFGLFIKNNPVIVADALENVRIDEVAVR